MTDNKDEQYGRSPLLEALPDLRTWNKLSPKNEESPMGYIRISPPLDRYGFQIAPETDPINLALNREADKAEGRGTEEKAEAEVRDMDEGGWNKP